MRSHTIRDTRAIRTLGSPVRQAIVDLIVARGALSIAELSEQLKRPADRLYYHVRLLERVGLVVSRESVNGDGRAEARFDVPGRPMRLAYDRTSTARKRAVGRVVGGILRSAQRDVVGALQDGSAKIDGPHRELWTGRVEGNLTPNEVAAVNKALRRVIDVLERSHKRTRATGRYFQFTWAFAPARRADASGVNPGS